MSTPRNPTRWSAGDAEAPDAFAALLRADEAAAADPAQLARVIEGVARQLDRPELVDAYRAQRDAAGPSGADAGADPGQAAQRASATGLRLSRSAARKLGVGLLALGVGLALWQGQRASRPAPAPTTQTPAATRAVQPPAQPQPGPALQPPPADTAAPPAEGAPAVQAPEPPRAVRPAPRAGAAAADPVAELGLLEPAQRALRDDPARTLALAEHHRARFARGQFEQEREMLAIEALLRLQRDAAARTRARAFERRFPNSSHLPRLHGLLAR